VDKLNLMNLRIKKCAYGTCYCCKDRPECLPFQALREQIKKFILANLASGNSTEKLHLGYILHADLCRFNDAWWSLDDVAGIHLSRGGCPGS